MSERPTPRLVYADRRIALEVAEALREVTGRPFHTQLDPDGRTHVVESPAEPPRSPAATRV